MTIALPLAVLTLVGGISIAFYAFWDKIVASVARLLEPYVTGIDRAAIPFRSEELAIGVIVAATIPWALVELLFRPPWPVAVALFLFMSCVTFVGVRIWINLRIVRRLAQFNEQLEMVLRLIAATMKVGLGLRQALVQVVADMPNPSRVEFMRVVSQTQIGVSLYDALDALSARMPSSEMMLFTSVVRLQGKTGGSLSRVLENLANTIKERRRLHRKIRTLTAEARMTKYIITVLPVFVGVFIMTFEPAFREGLLHSPRGWLVLSGVGALLSLGWYMFDRISVVDI